MRGLAPEHGTGLAPGESFPADGRSARLRLERLNLRGGRLIMPSYTAVVQQRDPWWIGWIQEVPGVNSQGRTRDELLDNLRSALEEALEMNRADALAAVHGEPYEEVSVNLAA